MKSLDNQGRARYLSKHGYVYVKVGKAHPAASNNGWALEHRVVWLEHGKALTGKLRHKNDNKQDNRLENLTDVPKPGPVCACGCGKTVPWKTLPSGFKGRGKYIPGHFQSKNAAYSHLNVSRERKRQLRMRDQGFCIKGGCHNKRVSDNYCEHHATKKWKKENGYALV